MAEQPIVIKKVVKKGHGHHGGAWKLAYADFVTAMMAFFLLMWLLGTTDEVTKKGISEYFQDPYEASKLTKGKVPTLKEVDPTEMDYQSEHEDRMHLEALKAKIEEMIKNDKKLAEFKEQIQLVITPEGLRVQIVDDKKTPMFKLGSAEAAPQIRMILKALAPVINELPNKITINGHTDSKPFTKFSKQYTNWELSSERANAARYELNEGGYDEKKILRVSGLSDSIPHNADDPLDPMNRRISIIVMNKKTELQLLKDSGGKVEAKQPGSGEAKPATATPAAVAEAAPGHEPKPHEPAEAIHAAEGASVSEHQAEAPAEAKTESATEAPKAPEEGAHGEAAPAAADSAKTEAEPPAAAPHGEPAKESSEAKTDAAPAETAPAEQTEKAPETPAAQPEEKH